MPIKTAQVSAFTGIGRDTIDSYIRNGELKAIKDERGHWAINIEDLASFFRTHPAIWHKFLTTPQKKQYARSWKLVLYETERQSGRCGPLYYALPDLCVLVGLTNNQLYRMVRNGKITGKMDGTVYFIDEDSVVQMIRRVDTYRSHLVNLESDSQWIMRLRKRLLYLLSKEDRNDNKGSLGDT